MKLLIVSPYFDEHGGGIERVAARSAEALAAEGHVCRWAATGKGAETISRIPLAAWDGLSRVAGAPLPLPSPVALGRLRKAIHASDAVVIHDALYLSSIAAMVVAKRAGRPIVLVQHIGLVAYRNPLLRAAMQFADRFVTRPMLRAATRAVFISAAVRDRFADIDWRRPPLLLFNGLEAGRFGLPSGEQRASVREELGVEDSRPLLLFVGRFVEKKGLSALRQIAAILTGHRFLLAGSGPIDPAAWGLPNVDCAGPVDRDRLAGLYAAADALVLPSHGEGYPLVVQEALACGLPVFAGLDSAAADPDAARFITGIEVAPDSPEMTAARFAAAIRDASLHRNAAASDYACAAYDWSAMARAIAHELT